MKKLKSIVTLGVLAAVMFLGLATTIRPVYVNAMADANLGAKSPWPANSEPDGAHVHYIRRQGQYAGIQPEVTLEAYYNAPISDEDWKKLYLQIIPGAGDDLNESHVCDQAGLNPNDTFIVVTLDTSSHGGGSPKQYQINKDQVCKQRDYNRKADLNDTGKSDHNVFYGAYDLPGKPAPDPATGKLVVDISIAYANNVPVDDHNGIRFVVKGPVGNPDIGENGSLNDSRTFSILANWDLHTTPEKATKIAIPFGASCNANNPDVENAHVRIYDADNGLGFDDTVTMKVKNTDTGDYISFRGNQGTNDGFGSNGDNGNGSLSDDDTGNNTIYTPPNGSGAAAKTSWVSIPHFKVGVHYQLEVRGLDPRNTIALGLPGDAIFGVINCPTNNHDVKCQITPDNPIPVGKAEKVSVKATTTGYGGNPPNKMNISITNPGNQTKNPNGGPNYTAEFDLGTFDPGEHTVAAKVTDPNDANVKDTCTGQFTVLYEPYVSIYGGDAAAGVSPQYNSGNYGAYSNTAGGFYGWNDTNGSGTWGSAGAQWAVQALGNIYGFASGRGVDNNQEPQNTEPQYLSFANTDNVNLPSSSYGGQFDGRGNIKNSYADIVNDPTANTYNADKYLALPALNNGTHRIDVVKNGHDAYIGSDITYRSATWTSTSEIPSYTLIVRGGDIYIDKGVGQLTGTFVSIYNPATDKGGNIYTCAKTDALHTTFTQINFAAESQNYYADCQTQLKIYGSVAAKKVHFDRTAGSYANQYRQWNNSDAAETIIYGPAMWLSTIPGTSNNYSAITGLPPIL